MTLPCPQLIPLQYLPATSTALCQEPLKPPECQSTLCAHKPTMPLCLLLSSMITVYDALSDTLQLHLRSLTRSHAQDKMSRSHTEHSWDLFVNY